MRKNNNQNLINVMILLSVIIIFSFTIEGLLGVGDITIIFLLLLFLIVLLYMLKYGKLYKIESADIILYIFIVYMLCHGLLFNNLQRSIIVIASSFVPYYLARYIVFSEEAYILFRKVINIIGWITIIKLIMEYTVSENTYRVAIENTNVIANGELLGMFALVNLFNLHGINKNIFNIFNYVIAIIICLLVLSTRGTVFAIFLATFIILFLISRRKMMIILSTIAIPIFYLFIFSPESPLIKQFPQLYRFTPKGILSDQSVVGGGTGLGRIELYEESIRAFKEHLLFGVGIGEIYSHNIFLEIASALGGIGLLLFIFFIIIIFYKSIKILKINTVIVSLFLYTFIYRQSSFALNAHKSMLILCGIIVATYLGLRSKEFNEKKQDSSI